MGFLISKEIELDGYSNVLKDQRCIRTIRNPHLIHSIEKMLFDLPKGRFYFRLSMFDHLRPFIERAGADPDALRSLDKKIELRVSNGYV